MGTDSVIYFRTDGNSEIASGHIVRCLSIARACLKVAERSGKSVSIIFLVADEESRDMVHSFLEPLETISILVLDNASYAHLELELPALKALLSQGSSSRKDSPAKRPVLFLDSYFLTPEYLEALKPYAYLACLDDLQLFDYPVDWIINYDLLTPQTRSIYEKKYSSAKKKLLGAAYTPLREQFTEDFSRQKQSGSMDQTQAHTSPHVLISSGGSDPCHTCLHLLEFLTGANSASLSGTASRPVFYDVIVGRANEDKAALKALSETFPCIVLHENVTGMAALMSSCNLAISAAGTTLYELCALGIPAASFVLADNQLASARAFEAAGLIPLLGDVRVNENQVLTAAGDFIQEMLSCPQKQKETAAAMQQSIDGLGAMRIAEAIME